MATAANILYAVGDRVFYRTFGKYATILRITEYGDITIQVDSDPIPVTTRTFALEAVGA